MKILVATDGSQCSDDAVEEVTRRPWPDGSTVRAVVVVEPPAPLAPGPYLLSNDFYAAADEAGTAAAGHILERAASALRGGEGTARLGVTTGVLRGSPRREIVEEAERWEADIIVVGSHGYKSWERMLLGSVSQSVAAHAACTVEIVRSRESKEKRSEVGG